MIVLDEIKKEFGDDYLILLEKLKDDLIIKRDQLENVANLNDKTLIEVSHFIKGAALQLNLDILHKIADTLIELIEDPVINIDSVKKNIVLLNQIILQISCEIKQNQSQINLMIIDDLQINAVIIKRMLKNFNFKSILSYSNLDDAVKMINHNCDEKFVILLDIILNHPERGYKLVDKITVDMDNIYLIIESVIWDDKIKKLCIRKGIHDYITKPIDMKILQKKVIKGIELLNNQNQIEY